MNSWKRFGSLLEAAAECTNRSARACLELTLLPIVKRKDYPNFEFLLRSYRRDFNVTDDHDQAIGLLAAVRCGNVKIMKDLISSGVNVNTPSIAFSLGSVLHAAVESKSLKIIRYLISVGADVNGRGLEGETVLQAAVEYQTACPNVIRYLASAGDASTKTS